MTQVMTTIDLENGTAEQYRVLYETMADTFHATKQDLPTTTFAGPLGGFPNCDAYLNSLRAVLALKGVPVKKVAIGYYGASWTKPEDKVEKLLGYGRYADQFGTRQPTGTLADFIGRR